MQYKKRNLSRQAFKSFDELGIGKPGPAKKPAAEWESYKPHWKLRNEMTRQKWKFRVWMLGAGVFIFVVLLSFAEHLISGTAFFANAAFIAFVILMILTIASLVNKAPRCPECNKRMKKRFLSGPGNAHCWYVCDRCRLKGDAGYAVE